MSLPSTCVVIGSAAADEALQVLGVTLQVVAIDELGLVVVVTAGRRARRPGDRRARGLAAIDRRRATTSEETRHQVNDGIASEPALGKWASRRVGVMRREVGCNRTRRFRVGSLRQFSLRRSPLFRSQHGLADGPARRIVEIVAHPLVHDDVVKRVADDGASAIMPS